MNQNARKIIQHINTQIILSQRYISFNLRLSLSLYPNYSIKFKIPLYNNNPLDKINFFFIHLIIQIKPKYLSKIFATHGQAIKHKPFWWVYSRGSQAQKQICHGIPYQNEMWPLDSCPKWSLGRILQAKSFRPTPYSHWMLSNLQQCPVIFGRWRHRKQRSSWGLEEGYKGRSWLGCLYIYADMARW